MKEEARMQHLNDYDRIARELGYPDDVIKRIRNAKDDYERDRILKDARDGAKDVVKHWRSRKNDQG